MTTPIPVPTPEAVRVAFDNVRAGLRHPGDFATLRWLVVDYETRKPLAVSEADINLLLAEAAMVRSSYLGGDGEVLADDGPEDNTTEMYRQADRFDALAEKLAPFCVPPLAEFRQTCADCEDGKRHGHVCNSCRGTALWPPVNPNGSTWRLLPEETV